MNVYPNLTITFLIECGGKFLLVSRGKIEENFPNLWAFPGGKVEISETVIDAIRREVKEETDLELTDDAVFLDSYFFKSTIGIAFLVRSTHENVKLSNELSDYQWITSLEDIKNYNCIPGIYNHLKRAKEKLDKGDFDSLEEMNLVESKYLNK